MESQKMNCISLDKISWKNIGFELTKEKRQCVPVTKIRCGDWLPPPTLPAHLSCFIGFSLSSFFLFCIHLIQCIYHVSYKSGHIITGKAKHSTSPGCLNYFSFGLCTPAVLNYLIQCPETTTAYTFCYIHFTNLFLCLICLPSPPKHHFPDFDKWDPPQS